MGRGRSVFSISVKHPKKPVSKGKINRGGLWRWAFRRDEKSSGVAGARVSTPREEGREHKQEKTTGRRKGFGCVEKPR